MTEDEFKFKEGSDINETLRKIGEGLAVTIGMTKHVNPGTDTTVNPVVIDDSYRERKQQNRCIHSRVCRFRFVSDPDCDGLLSGDAAKGDRCSLFATPTPAQPSDNKGDLVYGSVTKSGEDWRLRSFDAGMGETEYRIFRDGVFFAQFDNRKDADTVMELMTGAQPTSAQQRIDAAKEACEKLHSDIFSCNLESEEIAGSLEDIIALLQAGPHTCAWLEDDDGNWDTTCGHAWTFFEGTPNDNGLVYCPFCGALLQAGEQHE